MNELLPSPHITALNDKEQIQQMRSYLFQLKESLEFILTNIGKENLSAPMLKELQKIGVSIEEVQNDVDMRQKTTVGLINESNLTVSDVIESPLFEAEKKELKEYADTVANEAAQNPGEHEHTVGDITDFPSTIPPSAHTHTKSEVTDFAHTHTKSEISDFPSSMTPTAHTHSKSEITDFPTSIPPSEHTHAYTTVTDTRSDNQTPEWYFNNHKKMVVNEFKYTYVIGLSGEHFAILTTYIPWEDSSGGYPKQVAMCNGVLHTRVGISATAWSAWSTLHNTVIVSSDPGEGATVSYPEGTIIYVK